MQGTSKSWTKCAAGCCLFIGLALAVNACGDGDSDEGEAPKTVYGEIVVSDSVEETDNGSFELTKVTTCKLDSESDFLEIAFSGGNNKLIVKVQDAAVGSFTCTQDDTDFDNCLVYGEVLSANGSSKANGYSMAQDSDAGTTSAEFTYAGACSVNLSELSPSVEGSITCTGMVQTKLNGTARNPIEDDVTATLAVPDFHCTPK